MISTLIRKELAVRFRTTSSVRSRIFQWVFGLLGVIFVLALVVFMTGSLDRKMMRSNSESAPYLVTLFLFVFACFNCVDGALRLRKSVFFSKDSDTVTALPFKPNQVVFSKAVVIYLYELAECIVLSLPILVVYAYNRSYGADFYVVSVVYCLVVSLFIYGLSMVLATVFQLIAHLIKGKSLIQFLLATAVVLGLCVLYYYFLKLFLVSLDSETSIDGALPEVFVENLGIITEWMVPVSNFIRMWIMQRSRFLNSLVIVAGIVVLLILGFVLLVSGYKARDKREGTRFKRKKIKELSPFWNLVRKEATLIFKDSPSIFSYTTLLVLMPLLASLVISAFNQILGSNLAIVLDYYPRLLEVTDMTLILIFIAVINSAASLSISREGKGFETYRTLPYSPLLTISSKMLVNFLCSSISLVTTCAVLAALGWVGWQVAVTSLFAGLLLIVSENFEGVLIDVNDRRPEAAKLSFLSAMLPILEPLIIGLISFLVLFFTRTSWAIFFSFFVSSLVIASIPVMTLPVLQRMLEEMEV